MATESSPQLILRLRRQALRLDENRRRRWMVEEWAESVRADRLAVVICDMWDRHWSRGATERVEELAPRIDRTVRAARDLGVRILHCPGQCADAYNDTPARRRMKDIPPVAPPPERDIPDPPRAIDTSISAGSDTEEPQEEIRPVWMRQHPAIAIDQERDGISEDGAEVYSFVKENRIQRLVYMGVHTNMCVLHRPFGIKQMLKWGVDVALARDLTDAMCNPACPPYVNHEEGTRLVVEYIEKFFCPSLFSGDLCQAQARS